MSDILQRAFPCEFYDRGEHYQEMGMSLRDYFAAKAMQGYISSLDDGRLNYTAPSTIASYAYDLADSMLAAREVSK